MVSVMGSLHAMYFDDVATAVEYCHDLVPHIIDRVTSPDPRPDDERPVVWFHVPPRCTQSTRDGCYLFLTAAALEAARRAGLDTPVSGVFHRSALPTRAVLLFGEDGTERRVVRRRRRATHVAAPYPERSMARLPRDHALEASLDGLEISAPRVMP